MCLTVIMVLPMSTTKGINFERSTFGNVVPDSNFPDYLGRFSYSVLNYSSNVEYDLNGNIELLQRF